MYELILLQNLRHVSVTAAPKETKNSATYPENGNASSRAKAYAIRAFASMAEQPVKNWTRMTKNHMMVPPTLPPAFKKI